MLVAGSLITRSRRPCYATLPVICEPVEMATDGAGQASRTDSI